MTNIEISKKSVIKKIDQAEAICDYFKVGDLVLAKKHTVKTHSIRFQPKKVNSKEKVNLDDVFLITSFKKFEHQYSTNSKYYKPTKFAKDLWCGDFIMEVLSSTGCYYCDFGNLNPTKFFKKIN